MTESVATRVIEICENEWVVQFEGGLNGWTTFSDVFPTQAEAEAFQQNQINTVDNQE